MAGVRIDAQVIASFLDEWEQGWAAPSADVAQANRLAMQQQLVMLIASGGTTTGKHQEETPRDGR